jgi:hypothetical protein
VKVENWIAVAAAAVALLGALLTGLFATLNLRRERLNQRMQHLNLTQAYFSGLRGWADQLSDALSEAIHLAELDPPRCTSPTFFERRNLLRIRISSFIDRGRWYFPNLKTEEVGLHEPKAFRGYRQDVLNSLVVAYKALTSMNYVDSTGNERCREALVEAKKSFVSEIQSVLDPQRREGEFVAITRDLPRASRREASPNESLQLTNARNALSASTAPTPRVRS